MNKTLTLNDIFLMLSTLSDSDQLWLSDKLRSNVKKETNAEKLAKLKFPHIPKNRKISAETMSMVIGPMPEGFDFDKATDEMWEEFAK